MLTNEVCEEFCLRIPMFGVIKGVLSMDEKKYVVLLALIQ